MLAPGFCVSVEKPDAVGLLALCPRGLFSLSCLKLVGFSLDP